MYLLQNYKINSVEVLMIMMLSVLGLVLVSLVGCQLWDRNDGMPTMPGDSSALTNYAQMEEGSTVVDGQQINWVVSRGSFWVYVEVNQQNAANQLPGEHQVPVRLGDMVLHFSELPDEVTQIRIGVKAVHDGNDDTFTERGLFDVMDGSVNIPLAYADLVYYFGKTHYSIWFHAIGRQNVNGTACGTIALSGIMPGGQSANLSQRICFGTNPASASGVLAPVNLGTAGNYAILTKAGVSCVPSCAITGDIGVSPIDSTAITGFGLTMDATNKFSTSGQVTGKVYAANYTAPTPSNLTTAISNMETAYTDAAGRASDYTELYSGNISGRTLQPGVYKWGTGVLIASDVTLHGGVNDVFIFQIAQGITQSSGTKIILTGGVQARNIFWQASETVSIGTGAHFEGILLAKTNIAIGANASINGRMLAQTAVTLIQNTVVAP